MSYTRGLITLTLFVLFILLTIWAWSSRRKSTFDQLARLPLIDDLDDFPVSQDKP